MNVVQLTFIVAVNMMGSGIIMLPTNMAQVGAISLLSWLVTGVGSMAIAYGFAQAGIFNTREGGMSAYAEDAYGKSGYFIVFFLYFVSLAIGNVAIGISAVGYLSEFFPGLSATPIATTLGVIGLLWLTTVANFGGPSVTGKIGSVTVWGVILPVGLLSFAGWFWFKSSTFAEAWNPQGLSLGQGMGSSIALTLWAFLGMESAAQNSSAVENPKRDVPLACLFGTLGAAVIYVLSTTVIQGIVPNAELAKSTGPFGLAFAHMFNPTVGSIVMALAVLACLGSLLGWQFTISRTAKAAADEHMFPSFFSKVNRMDAPVVGMVVMGIVQSVLALSTISPSLSEQFGVLVSLAVVTNVIPYIIALSALPLMMKNAGVDRRKYRTNLMIAVVAMLYSTYAIYASGKDAVMGGTLVMALGFIIWGFIAYRFAAVRRTAVAAAAAVALFLMVSPTDAFSQAKKKEAPAAGTLDRVRSTGTLKLGYRTDARPFSYEEGGSPAGFSVELCQRLQQTVKSELSLPDVKVQWVPLTADTRLEAVQRGDVDVLCGAMTETLERRKQVDFSTPVFPGGVGVVVRSDAPRRLKNILAGEAITYTPTWKAVALNVLREQVFAVVPGTTAEQWVKAKAEELQVQSRIDPVANHQAGVQAVLDRKASAFFAERASLLDAARHGKDADDLKVLDRHFTVEPLALGLRRGDEDFRLLVDRTLSQLYTSADFTTLYTKWFGEPDEDALEFYRWNALPN